MNLKAERGKVHTTSRRVSNLAHLLNPILPSKKNPHFKPHCLATTRDSNFPALFFFFKVASHQRIPITSLSNPYLLLRSSFRGARGTMLSPFSSAKFKVPLLAFSSSQMSAPLNKHPAVLCSV